MAQYYTQLVHDFYFDTFLFSLNVKFLFHCIIHLAAATPALNIHSIQVAGECFCFCIEVEMLTSELTGRQAHVSITLTEYQMLLDVSTIYQVSFS